MISAGRVLLMPKGAYNPSTTYEMLDIVSYNGSSYIAKGTTTGNLPTDTTYWQLSAYGGQAANVAGNFAELEISSVASMTHYADDIFVDENSQLMKATQTINIGDTIDVNTNCTPTTVEALLISLSARMDSLDSVNRKIQGAIEIAAQTDLHSLALGEYYKKQTSFYVTNAPTGIDQDPTAVFRLTIEAALDNASQASSPLLLTLRTPDGKIFTQGYDGTTWKSWEEIANENSVATKQNITDNTLQTTSKTVPGAINELNSKNQTLTNNLSDEIETRAKLGAHNQFHLSAITNASADITTVNNGDGTVTVSGTPTSSQSFFLKSDHPLEAGQYNFFGLAGTTNLEIYKLYLYNGNTAIKEVLGTSITVQPSDVHTEVRVAVRTIDNNVAVSGTIKPMMCLSTDANTDYQPYAMTNRELTEVKTGTISNGAEYSTYIDSVADQSLIKVGKMCIFNYNFVMKAAATADKTVFTLSEKPTNTCRLRGASQDNNHPLDLKITTSGEVQVYQGVANTRYNGQIIFFTV